MTTTATRRRTRGQAQHLQALALANETRLRRAALKRELASLPSGHAATSRAAELIADPPPELHGMTAFELIGACRGYGRERTYRFLRRLEIAELRRIGELTDRQRRMLVAALRSAT